MASSNRPISERVSEPGPRECRLNHGRPKAFAAQPRAPTDQPFGHRTLFFRDPDGNVLEIYAEIAPLAQRA
jgi:hypothetical protein